MTKTWIDIEGNEQQWVTGPAKVRELQKLSIAANEAHETVAKCGRTTLDEAYKAGKALLHAKKICGGRSKWGKWRARNFKASKPTSCVYMRIARNWNDPVLVDLRKSGDALTIARVIKTPVSYTHLTLPTKA